MKTILIKTLLLIGLMSCSSPHLMAASEKSNKNILIKNFAQLCIDAKNGKISTIKNALQNNPNIITMATDRGATLLGIASEYNQIQVVELLLQTKNQDQKAQIIATINHKTQAGETALMMASFKGNRHIVDLLLKNGADVSLASNAGETALMMATSQKHTKIAESILKRAPEKINDCDTNGDTVLMSAACTGNNELVYIFLEAGADVAIKNNNGHTALMYAKNKQNHAIEAVLDTTIHLLEERKLIEKKASEIVKTAHSTHIKVKAFKEKHEAVLQLFSEGLQLARKPLNATSLQESRYAKNAFLGWKNRLDQAIKKTQNSFPLDPDTAEQESEADARRAFSAAAPVGRAQEAHTPQKNPKQPIIRTCINCFRIQKGNKKTIKMAVQKSAESQPLFKFCAGCPQEPDHSKRSYYCTIECQTKHWPTHKQTCPRIDIKDDTESTSEDDQPEETLSRQEAQCAHAQEANYDGPCPQCHPYLFCEEFTNSCSDPELQQKIRDLLELIK